MTARIRWARPVQLARCDERRRIYQPNATPPRYAPNTPTTGVGEDVALVALLMGVTGGGAELHRRSLTPGSPLDVDEESSLYYVILNPRRNPAIR